MAHVLASELRESVLVAAMTGRLTKQVDEESSLDLLETIRKNKKIKNKIKDMENDFPYDIPESWLKPKLGEVFDVIMGQSPDNSSITNVKTDNSLEFHQGKILFTKDLIGKSDNYVINPNKIAPKNSVLLCVRAPIGTVNWTDRDLSIGRGLCSIIPVAGIKTKFTMILLKTLNDEFVKQGTGSTFKAITADVILNQRIPLPPIEEQARIVTRVDELMTKIDEYEKLENELVELKKNFPGDMKAAVLQTAMQGKLTEQNETEKPSFLDEKANVDDYDYDLPDNWTVAKMSFISDLYTGNSISETIKKSKYVGLSDGLNYIGTKDVGFDHVIDYENGVKIPIGEPKFKIAKKDATLLCIEGGSAGKKMGIIKEDVCFGNKLCSFNAGKHLDSKFQYYVIQSPIFGKMFAESISGMIGGVSVNKLKDMLIPLPPIEEQKRIVEKLDKILPLCEELEKEVV